MDYASYLIWLEYVAQAGKEEYHCHLKQYWSRIKKYDSRVKPLLLDTPQQLLGKLAQRGVFEFHQNPDLLSYDRGVERVTALIKLNQQPAEVQDKVRQILIKYQEKPVLLGKHILLLNPGNTNEVPEPIIVTQGSYQFKLYANFDCVLQENDNIIHIVDLKTGHHLQTHTGLSNYDNRQAHVYLLAASYLYPKAKTIASFYNLETQQWSSPYHQTPSLLARTAEMLAIVAKRHQQDKRNLVSNPENFHRIFRPHPGLACQYCQFTSICSFADLIP
ncbi:PD-(D/E)XK nuclease family protein [Planktothrix sp. FACHB-1355]|uniref:PD-(D/E)XK nuclease family protein n=1 Tax=Aerosakkonema funiforme FACHB-1375 TaxID=2949571 RepID=A0A926VI68_9CYAN|nr:MULTISPECIES: PD-(D/E)XK nuclease family protein [Oscillatoriales]MBD2184421.1 PD-(D/E)XK nuclease family protein [Aerosakkonema funiforme FACHB-1375]MBD3559308.1 PD-(D/E)XK nuclease family protein [Planktothrix sp. FACHB-1355]